jgi:hypothetical protein
LLKLLKKLDNVFPDKEKKPFLLFLAGALKDGSITKKHLLQVKLDLYKKKKNKKWVLKMERMLKGLLEDGETFSEALVNAGIINPAEEIKFKLATTESEGIKRILEESTHTDNTLKYFFFIFGGPMIVSSIWLFGFELIKNFNHKTFKPLDKVVEIQGGAAIEYPILFEDPYYFQMLFIITFSVAILVIIIYHLLKNFSPYLFNNVFLFKSHQLFAEMLEELNKGRRLGIPDLISSEYLYQTSSGLKKEVYKQINRIQDTGDVDKTISGVFEEYGYDPEICAVLEIGEKELQQFWEYSSVAESIIIEKRLEFDSRMDKITFLIFYYLSSAYFVIPFFILGVFYMFDVTAQVM